VPSTFSSGPVSVSAAGRTASRMATRAKSRCRVGAPIGRERFQGISPDDAICLIVPDRFANGDPTNYDLPVGHGFYNCAKSRHYYG
jgi:hypothetical protein